MMQKNKKLRLLALAAAFLAALHSAIDCVLILFPKPLISLMTTGDTELPALLTGFRLVDAVYPLLLTAACLYMSSGKELKPKKTAVSLIMLVVYFGLGLMRTFTNLVITNLAGKLYGAATLGAYSALRSMESFIPPFATIALLLAVAVAAIEFYETHKKDDPEN